MKIALLMSVASPQSRDIALQIENLGHELHIVSAANVNSMSYVSRDDPYQQENIRVLEATAKEVYELAYGGAWGMGVFRLARRLSRILSDANVDVLLTIHGGAYAAAACLSGFRPYAVYVGGSDILFARHVKKYLSRISLTTALVVFANGRHLAERTREVAPRANVMPLYIGTDTSKFRPGVKAKSPISILCTRGFMPIYNNELLIHALSHLAEDLPEHETVFAAAGPELEQARSLAQRILTPNQRRRVKFLGGADRDSLAELLSRAHVYVSVSLSDGTSLSLMEALASGAFPILSNIPANQEWINQEPKNGFLVSCDNSQELAAALTVAINDNALRSVAAERNRRLVLEKADLKANMAIMLRELARNADLPSPLMDISTESRS